jgi:hypothetical protein
MAKIFLTLKINGSYSIHEKSIAFEDLHHLYYKNKIDQFGVTNCLNIRYYSKDTEGMRSRMAGPFNTSKILALRVREFTNQKIDAFFAFEDSVVKDFFEKLIEFGASGGENNVIWISSGEDSFGFMPESIQIEVFKDKTSFNKALKENMSKEDLEQSAIALEKLAVINSFEEVSTLESIVYHPSFIKDFLNDKDFVNYFLRAINLLPHSDKSERLNRIKAYMNGKAVSIKPQEPTISVSQAVVLPAKQESSKNVENDSASSINEPTDSVLEKLQKLYEQVGRFSEGFAYVKKGKKYGYVNVEGNLISEIEFDDVANFWNGLAQVKQKKVICYIDKTGKVLYEKIGNACFEDRRTVQKDTKYGYVDNKGNLVIGLEWDYATEFENGLGCVEKAEKYGYVDKDGKLAIALDWDMAWRFSEGLGRVMKDDKRGYIDTNGKVVVALEWDGARDFNNGVAIVKKDGLYGLIDTSGNIIAKPQWKDIGSFNDGIANADLPEGGSVKIDLKGYIY